MCEMIIDVPENWKAFYLDVAERMKADPAKFWGKYFTNWLKSAMDDNPDWLFSNLQKELMKKHGITKDGEIP